MALSQRSSGDGRSTGKGILKRAGFQKENMKEEVYWVPSKAA